MKPAANINDHFFDGNYKEAWRNHIPPGLTEAEVDFILDVSGVSENGSVLDLMCGYGRHTIELARRGRQVSAIDNAAAYIAELQEIAVKERLPIDCRNDHVLHADWGGYYHAVICMGNSFAFFAKEEASSLLKKISGHLFPGGSLIINSWMVAEIALQHFKSKDWYYAGPYQCILEYEYHFHPSRIESEQTIIGEDGTREVLKGIDYIYSLNEMDDMLQAAGLKISGLFSTPRKRPFQVGDSRIYMVAHKEV